MWLGFLLACMEFFIFLKSYFLTYTRKKHTIDSQRDSRKGLFSYVLSCLVFISFVFFVAFAYGRVGATRSRTRCICIQNTPLLCVTSIQMKIYNIIAHITFINTTSSRRRYKMYKIKEGATKNGLKQTIWEAHKHLLYG